MIKPSLIVLLGLVALLSSGCSRNEPCDILIMPPIATFALQEKWSHTTLIGTDKVYHPDTILALNKDFCPYIEKHRNADTVLSFNYGQIKSSQPIPFFISRTDIDTFSIVYTSHSTDCGELKDLILFVYNYDTTTFDRQFAVGEKK